MGGLENVLLTIAGIAIPPLIAWGLTILQQKTHIQLSDQQNQIILGAAQTAAGEIVTGIARGIVKVDDVARSHPAVLTAAKSALNVVADSAAARGVDLDGMARLVVGKVGQLLAADPTVSTIAPGPVPALAPMPAAVFPPPANPVRPG